MVMSLPSQILYWSTTENAWVCEAKGDVFNRDLARRTAFAKASKSITAMLSQFTRRDTQTNRVPSPRANPRKRARTQPLPTSTMSAAPTLHASVVSALPSSGPVNEPNGPFTVPVSVLTVPVSEGALNAPRGVITDTKDADATRSSSTAINTPLPPVSPMSISDFLSQSRTCRLFLLCCMICIPLIRMCLLVCVLAPVVSQATVDDLPVPNL